MTGDPLAGFTRFEFDDGRWTREVYKIGAGPAVIVIHEVPGLHPGVLEFARDLAASGLTAYCPSLFGKPANPAFIEKILKDLSLWDKRDSRIMRLSGGMKRRVMIAKALSHEPSILFLDEPTAGVDVTLRRDMWNLVRELRANGATIILTTHYIEEAEEMADRVGVINKGEIVLVEDKVRLMQKLGKKQLKLHLQQPLAAVPDGLRSYGLELVDGGRELVYTYDTRGERTGITTLMNDLSQAGIRFNDLNTTQSSLEEIFVSLVKR